MEWYGHTNGALEMDSRVIIAQVACNSIHRNENPQGNSIHMAGMHICCSGMERVDSSWVNTLYAAGVRHCQSAQNYASQQVSNPFQP